MHIEVVIMENVMPIRIRQYGRNTAGVQQADIARIIIEMKFISQASCTALESYLRMLYGSI